MRPEDGRATAEAPSGRRLAEGVAFALLAVSLWGGWFVITRRAVGAGGVLGPADLVALRFGIGGLLLLPVLALRLRGLDRRAYLDGAVLYVAQGAPFALLISIALRYAPAGHGAALTPGTMPLFAALLGALVLGDRPGRLALAGLGLIAAGALTLAGGFRDADELFGYGLLLTAAFLWAAGTVRMRRSRLTALEATALICVGSLVTYIPVYLASGLSRLLEAAPAEVALQALYQGVLVSVVALVAFNRSLGLIGRRTPAFTALVPVIATILAIPVLGEVPDPLHVGAILAIGAGVLLTTRG
ncbi:MULTISPECIES: DMT family transporter [Methylobacterium]|uniref:DMT family transporter n=2 Tax=Methylobacteriaceae TaxID=119045 RepID=UPI0008EF222D|nr:DMT family transporter [Methylobacterium sp. yr596]MBK3399209.1 DMT family transporter [Methylobacterium ajmalii]MBK3410527.1 DMT family transporter [Methylobacterium ajmalii]MBZ6412320.1 DMT family transporter [Methylobacterium sp.]SFE71846.1 Threonine/homoserine efflux transporter RhtA [Methylobacterium sp. yr596]